MTRLYKTKKSTPFVPFVLAVSFANLLLYHIPLIRYALANIEFVGFASYLTLATVVIAQFFVTVIILTIFGLISNRLVKYLAITFALTNSIAIYFVSTYNTILSKAMMGNVFNTNPEEATELFSLKILVYLVVFGVLPALLISRFDIQKTKITKKLILLGASVLFVLAWGFANSASWLWFDKHSKNIGGLSMPWSYTINAVSYRLSIKPNAEQVLLPDLAFKSPNDETIVVLVIGESARADRFGLYGYSKETTPLLQQREVFAFSDPISCTTYTTASIACMLSHKGASTKLLSNDEPLPSYLSRFGVGVIWRSKNWGEPKISVDSYKKSGELKKLCETCTDQEFDEVLLYGLKDEILALTTPKKFVVLHQSGSHGPSYHSKYPARFEKFAPVCKSVQLQECTEEELNSAYDNTIVYTDYILDKLIGELASLKKPAVMLYMSDHGESLGESGFYLHGTPNMLAPKYQRSVPFIVWISDEFKETRGLVGKNIVKENSYTQDYIFHSVLGAFEANATIYNERFDIFR